MVKNRKLQGKRGVQMMRVEVQTGSALGSGSVILLILVLEAFTNRCKHQKKPRNDPDSVSSVLWKVVAQTSVSYQTYSTYTQAPSIRRQGL